MTTQPTDARSRSASTAARCALAAAAAIALGAIYAFAPSPPRAAEVARPIPAPALDAAPPSGAETQVAVLAGGCFWGFVGRSPPHAAAMARKRVYGAQRDRGGSERTAGGRGSATRERASWAGSSCLVSQDQPRAKA